MSFESHYLTTRLIKLTSGFILDPRRAPSHQPKKEKKKMSTSDLPPLITPDSPDSDFANGLDSLPSSPTTSSSSALSDDDLDESDAEREWKESIKQLELLLTVVVVPYLGKYFGRKCAYWGECARCSSLLYAY